MRQFGQGLTQRPSSGRRPSPRGRLFALAGNAMLFNLAWFAIVLSQSSLLAPIVVAAVLLLHFCYLGRGLPELGLIVGVGVFGLVVDSSLFAAGVLLREGPGVAAPLWLSCLWPVLATTLQHAFAGLQRRPLLAAVLGAVGGATSYIAGTRLTAIAFADPLQGPLVIAAVWSLLFPGLLWLAARTAGRGAANGLAL